jgi:hypothetical protein
VVAVIAGVAVWANGGTNSCVNDGSGNRLCGSAATRYVQQGDAALGIIPSGQATGTSQLEVDVRNVIAAAEAYYADHNTYVGMTVGYFRQIDKPYPSEVTIESATADSYCLEADSGSDAASYSGPGGSILPVTC